MNNITTNRINYIIMPHNATLPYSTVMAAGKILEEAKLTKVSELHLYWGFIWEKQIEKMLSKVATSLRYICT